MEKPEAIITILIALMMLAVGVLTFINSSQLYNIAVETNQSTKNVENLTGIMARNEPSIALTTRLNDFYPGSTLLRIWVTNNGFVPVILWETYPVKQKCGSKVEEIGELTFSKFMSYKNPEDAPKTFAKVGAMAAYRAQLPPETVKENCTIIIEIETYGINPANALLEIPVENRQPE